MNEVKATSNYLNKKPRELKEAQILAIYNRLDEATNHIMMAHNTADPDKIWECIRRASDFLDRAREMAIECKR